MKALAEKQSGSLDGSLSSLQTALQLISSKRPGKSLLPPLSPSETVTVYLELVQVHTRLGHTHEAAKVMQDAINMFTGSPEEVRWVYMYVIIMAIVFKDNLNRKYVCNCQGIPMHYDENTQPVLNVLVM